MMKRCPECRGSGEIRGVGFKKQKCKACIAGLIVEKDNEMDEKADKLVIKKRKFRKTKEAEDNGKESKEA